MNTELIQPSLLERAIIACLSGLADTTARVYKARIREWLDWSAACYTRPDVNCVLDREHVKQYLRHLETMNFSAQVRNQVLAALKKLAVESSDLGWISADIAVQIQKIKGKKITGIRTGRWLTVQQSAALLRAPDRTTIIGKRDLVVLALLLGCGLRRSEVCSLTTAQLNRHNGTNKLLLTNLVGKGGRVRTVGVPDWAAQPLKEWIKEL